MEVAGVVASIISAFGSGRALFQRMAGKKRTGKGRQATPSEVDAWLRESLHNRPLEISRSYQKHVQRHGHRYEIGDSIAHSSLAHTLLTLNSGLITVINRFLSREPMTDDESRRTLLSLSEVAAADTLSALSQLSLRMNSQSVPAALKGLPRPPKEKAGQEKSEELKLKGGSGKPAAKQISQPSPLLIRGAWVRPKKSSCAASSNKKSGASKTSSASKHQKIKTESALLRAGGKKTGTPKSKQTEEPSKAQAKSAPAIAHQKWLPEVQRGEERPPSMLVTPSDYFLPREPRKGYVQDEVAPRSRPDPNIRARPKSSGTMYTSSTKIGEIPESRSSRRLQSVAESSYNPHLVEYLMSLPGQTEPDKPKKITRGMRFWKKDHRRLVEAA